MIRFSRKWQTKAIITSLVIAPIEYCFKNPRKSLTVLAIGILSANLISPVFTMLALAMVGSPYLAFKALVQRRLFSYVDEVYQHLKNIEISLLRKKVLDNRDKLKSSKASESKNTRDKKSIDYYDDVQKYMGAIEKEIESSDYSYIQYVKNTDSRINNYRYL